MSPSRGYAPAEARRPILHRAERSMNAEEREGTSPLDFPDDAVVVRQSNWAWMWRAVPWLVLFGVSLAFDFLTFGIVPAVIATIVIVPSYLSFRRTAYILTESYLIIQQGSFFGRHRIDLPFADLNDILLQPGTFGRSLGYTRVYLHLKDERMIFLQYVPLASPLVEHCRARMNAELPYEEEPGEKAEG